MNFETRLGGGDRRSIGDSDSVATEVAARPELLVGLIDAISSPDAVVRMRASDALEKVSREGPEKVTCFKDRILHEVAEIPQQEVEWHVAQILPRLDLSPEERTEAISKLASWFRESDSRIVRTSALESIVLFARVDDRFSDLAGQCLREAATDPAPSLRARARKLTIDHPPVVD